MEKDNTNPEESEAQSPAEQEEEQKDDTGSQASGDNSNEESTDEGESSESKAEARAQQLEEERNNIRDQLIAMREERRELRQQLEARVQSNDSVENQVDSQQDVTKVVESLLQQREQERAKDNRRKAFEKFIRENKMYHPENDTTGLMRERLESEVSQFNLSGVVETEDFYEYINKANRLLSPQSSQVKKTVNPYPTDPSSNGTTAHNSEIDSLSKKEKDLARKAGWSEERLKALKKTDPEYFQELMM